MKLTTLCDHCLKKFECEIMFTKDRMKGFVCRRTCTHCNKPNELWIKMEFDKPMDE